MRYATPMRRAGPMLEDAPGQMPGLLFVAKDVAPRSPGGADAAIGDCHHPASEEIGPSLHAAPPRAAAGGISSFEDDAEVEHGWGKENVRLFDYSKLLRFWAFSLAFLGKLHFPRKPIGEQAPADEISPPHLRGRELPEPWSVR